VRCLIIGCGCRGRALATSLIAAGHSVRGTSRRSEQVPALEAAGVEPFVGDPDRVGTIVPALQQVSVACLLLGSADGDPERVAALHGPRLEMLLEKMVDTTVRGVVYESAGTVAADVLERGRELLSVAWQRSRIPCTTIDTDPSDHHSWLRAAEAAIDRMSAWPGASWLGPGASWLGARR
jgi:nucleoside-diphosphate-sugar epimerase